MRISRTLPITLRPASELGESFSGYADRLASKLGVPLISLLYRVGVLDEERFSSFPVGYGVALGAEKLRAFTRVTRLEEATVSDMLLARYHGVCCDLSGLDPASPRTFPKAALESWAYFVGSHACPLCLAASGGVWRLKWKLPWSFACAEHGVLLADACPGCRRRIGAGRRDGRSAPAFPSRVPKPLVCRNALPEGLASAGRSAVPCGNDLRAVETQAASPPLLDAQRRIDAVLSGASALVAGEEVSSLDYFRDLRSLCALLLSVGQPGDLDDVPDPVRRAFARHARDRSETRERRGEIVASGGDWRTAPRSRPYTGPPQGAALMAAVCPAASRMLRAEDAGELAEAMEPFVERLRESARPSAALQRLAYFRFSPRLEAAAELCWSRHQKATARLGLGPAKTVNRSWAVSELKPENVPQLFWEEEFEKNVARLLPGISPRHARRFCSMWLVRAIEGCTWKQAATALGGPPEQGRAMANKAVSLLNADGSLDLFDARVRDIARRIASSESPIDYAVRRSMLADPTDIEPEEWKAICRPVGVHPGKRGGRRRYAVAWVWSELTSGDYRLSPAFREGCSVSDRESYRRFLIGPLPKLRPRLTAYGERMLDDV